MKETVIVYEEMLENIIDKIDKYMGSLEIIKENYDLQVKHKEVLLRGQLQMVMYMMESDKQQIMNILKK